MALPGTPVFVVLFASPYEDDAETEVLGVFADRESADAGALAWSRRVIASAREPLRGVRVVASLLHEAKGHWAS